MSDSREVSTSVIVGIDIGMTSTGVAFGIDRNAKAPTRNFEMHVVERWPGTDRIEYKVPTKVTYTAGELGVTSWGFGCPELGDLRGGQAIKDMFKFFLDTTNTERFRAEPEKMPKLENVRKWYTDFLRHLHAHIINYLPTLDVATRKDSTSIEFVFSIPTRWKDDDELLRMFRDIVDDAGFGNNVKTDLTEGEAAAIFVSDCLKHRFRQGEAFMVCDAGGATADLCVLRVTSTQDNSNELELLAEPQALHAGSVSIDERFEVRAQELLRYTNVDRTQIPTVALQITRGGFQTIKTQFGTSLTAHLPTATLRVPGTTEKITLRMEELKDMFDTEVKIMKDGIDIQIALLDTRVSSLVLAGGLGSSLYVQDQLREHCASKGLQLLVPPKPEDLPLAVCKGLVIDRVHNARHSRPVIPIRSSNSSYGILYKELHGERHAGQVPVIDQLDGRKYAENQIDWLVLKGSNYPRGHIIRRAYSIFAKPNIPEQSLSFTVVRSTSDSMPTFLDIKGDVEVIGHVVSSPQTRLHEHGIAQKRGVFPRKTVFSRLDCRLSAEIAAGKFEFNSTIAGPMEIFQTLSVQWLEENKGSDLIRVIY